MSARRRRGEFTGPPCREFHIDGRSIETVGDDIVAECCRDATVKGAGVGRGSPGRKPMVADRYGDFTVAAHTPTLPVTGGRGRGGN